LAGGDAAQAQPRRDPQLQFRFAWHLLLADVALLDRPRLRRPGPVVAEALVDGVPGLGDVPRLALLRTHVKVMTSRLSPPRLSFYAVRIETLKV
jgi:hypothetical protein